MDLHTAKLYVQMDTPQHLTRSHVAALQRAQLPVPEFALKKFPEMRKRGRARAEVLA